jgi:hypothetical protein
MAKPNKSVQTNLYAAFLAKLALRRVQKTFPGLHLPAGQLVLPGAVAN